MAESSPDVALLTDRFDYGDKREAVSSINAKKTGTQCLADSSESLASLDSRVHLSVWFLKSSETIAWLRFAHVPLRLFFGSTAL